MATVELVLTGPEEAVVANSDSMLALDGLRMVSCSAPNGCVSPGGTDDEFSCEAQGRCIGG